MRTTSGNNSDKGQVCPQPCAKTCQWLHLRQNWNRTFSVVHNDCWRPPGAVAAVSRFRRRDISDFTYLLTGIFMWLNILSKVCIYDCIELSSALVQSIRPMIPVLLWIPAFVSFSGALGPAKVFLISKFYPQIPVSYTHLTLPTNREV